MDRIAFIIGDTFVYWSSIVLTLAAATAICIFLAAYLGKSGNGVGAALLIPIALIASLALGRLVHWYSRSDSYAGLEAAMTDFTSGGYALIGVFAGCFLAALLHQFVFRKERPKAVYAFFMGAVMEVFHMYAVFITHRNDVTKSYEVVRVCALPMILFTGIGLAMCSITVKGISRENGGLFRHQPRETRSISHMFQFWMMLASTLVFIINFGISYALQTSTAMEEARYKLMDWSKDLRSNYNTASKNVAALASYLGSVIRNNALLVVRGVEAVGGVEAVREEQLNAFLGASRAAGIYTMDADGKMIRGVGIPWTDLQEDGDDTSLADLFSGKKDEALVADISSQPLTNMVIRCGNGYVRVAFNEEERLEAIRLAQYQSVFDDYKLSDESDYYLIIMGTDDGDMAQLRELEGYIVSSSLAGEIEQKLSNAQQAQLLSHTGGDVFYSEDFAYPALCRYIEVDSTVWGLILYDTTTAFASRDAQTYENAFSDLLVFAVLFVTVTLLMESMLARPLRSVNASLNRITEGNLNETVSVLTSEEFTTLSRDINTTVDVLKGYISAAEKRMEQELLMAKTIQAAALPRNFNFPRDEFELYALMDPAKEVGGDFYDFFFVDQNRLALVIADVSGKGIPAALFMMRAKTAIRNLAESGKAPAEIFAQANHILCEGNDAEMFVTAWIGIIDLKTGIMQCANAGHEYPAILRAGGEWELMKDIHSLALAAMDGIRMKEYELRLNPGDRLFVYTDGVPEAINEQIEQYGTDRMLAILNKGKDLPSRALLALVREDLKTFVGTADQFDDITMLGFSFLAWTAE